jgi:hypothetical protein
VLHLERLSLHVHSIYPWVAVVDEGFGAAISPAVEEGARTRPNEGHIIEVHHVLPKAIHTRDYEPVIERSYGCCTQLRLHTVVF